MFPVSGKANSFSLRTSAQLTYGVVLIFKYNIEAVRKDILRMRKLSYQGKTQTKVLVLVIRSMTCCQDPSLTRLMVVTAAGLMFLPGTKEPSKWRWRWSFLARTWRWRSPFPS